MTLNNQRLNNQKTEAELDVIEQKRMKANQNNWQGNE
jgi:hypothetical protein